MARIACIGGGTGLHTLLLGLKEVFADAQLSAIVTMMDSGGSTGRLRDEFGYLPPGDVRQSLVALSDAPQELRALMQHRFNASGSSLDGHVVGNILLTAFKDITGDEYAAIEAMERVLRIRGKVFPVTVDNCHLVARLEDGTLIKGETDIDIPKHDPSLKILEVFLEPNATLFPRTKEVLEDAQFIIIGPGDLYTSIMPNLAVQGMVEALQQAKRGGTKIIFVTNTMTKHGETNGFGASDFYNIIKTKIGPIDAVIVNNGKISDEQRDAYLKENAVPVQNDMGDDCVVVAEDLVNKDAFARHHPQKLARAIERAISRIR